jgi:quercetin dioxygenase-like cupin family protein
MIKYARLVLPPPNITVLHLQTQNLLAGHAWRPHLNTNHYTGNWDVMALRSPGGMLESTSADLMGAATFANTPLMQQLPAVQQFIDGLHCPVMAVRLLNLAAGAVIKPHRDHGLCFENGEARIHVPIFTNPQVEFYIEEERLLMQPGESWYINANLTHNVTNAGTTDRIHLVIDCEVNEWLKEVFDKSEKATAQQQQSPEEIRRIVNELRRMNTTVADKLADDLLKTIEA